ncbi:MAG: tetratricopeptide repeat protein, partial [Gemmatimonadota bacterium]|nr:tetratricopeptide repeat protein [Gemmatimonadota bacterium]
MILNWKFRSGFSALFCSFFILGTASICFAEDGEPEMTKADSINKAGQHLGWGARYLKSKQYEDAETQFLKSWGLNPKRARTARELGKLYEEIEKYEDAITWFQKAVELEPTSKYTKIPHIALARIYKIQEQPEKAIEHYEALLAFDLEAEQKIQYYRELITLYALELKDYEKSLEYAKKWGELAPEEPEVRDMISDLNRRTGREDEALAEKEKVLELNPDDYETLEELAGMYLESGDNNKAFDAFEKLYQNDVSSVFFLEETIKLGKMLSKSKSWVVGRREKLHAMQPENLGVIEELAVLTESLKWVNKGLKQDSQNGRYPYMRGEHYFDRWENSGA